MRETERSAVECDCGDAVRRRLGVSSDNRLFKPGAVAGEPAGNRQIRSQNLRDSGKQCATVHGQSVGQDKQTRQIGRLRLAGQARAAGL